MPDKKNPEPFGVFYAIAVSALLEQRLARQTIFFQDLAQPLQAFHLNLSDPLPGQADFQAYVFKGCLLYTSDAADE